jgi:hypothetical protein
MKIFLFQVVKKRRVEMKQHGQGYMLAATNVFLPNTLPICGIATHRHR